MTMDKLKCTEPVTGMGVKLGVSLKVMGFNTYVNSDENI
jgi:hypothetical protein